jgi:hypothetical protein
MTSVPFPIETQVIAKARNGESAKATQHRISKSREAGQQHLSRFRSFALSRFRNECQRRSFAASWLWI